MAKKKSAPEKPKPTNGFRDRVIEFRRVLASEILPNSRNYRTHPAQQRAAFKGIMNEIGFAGAELCYYSERNDGKLTLIDGAMRLSELPGADLPCLITDLTDAEADKLLLTYDPIAALAEANADALDKLLREVQTGDSAVAKLLEGLAKDNGLLAGLNGDMQDPEPQIDRAAELQKKWKIERGQLWLIPSASFPGGVHRLLCGDSTKPEDVDRVMSGQKAGLMNTDPPYGVKLNLRENHEASNAAKGINKTYREFEGIENDELNGRELQSFLESAIKSAVPHLIKNAAFYLWHPMLTQGTFFAAAAAAAADILIHRQIIWVKPHFIFGRGDYHWKHELCFYGWQKGNRPKFYGERNQDTVWVLNEGGGSIRKDQNHPTQKPIELFIRPMRNHLQTGEIAYEPFAGSGSQFVAGENLGRIVYGCEIAPQYVAVCLERLADMGLEPRLA